jgi:predicted GIY-YIG superfamily endonuclease
VYFVYILVCAATGRSYVGHTDHLIRRFRRHCAGGTRTTREKLLQPFVAHWEVFPSRAAAMQRERYFKAGSGHRVRQQIVAASPHASPGPGPVTASAKSERRRSVNGRRKTSRGVHDTA